MLLQEKIYFALGWKSNCVTLKKLAFTAHFKESFECLIMLKISSLKSIIDSDDTRSPSIVVSICVDERLGGGGAARY